MSASFVGVDDWSDWGRGGCDCPRASRCELTDTRQHLAQPVAIGIGIQQLEQKVPSFEQASVACALSEQVVFAPRQAGAAPHYGGAARRTLRPWASCSPSFIAAIMPAGSAFPVHAMS